jgi:hypothetical protein
VPEAGTYPPSIDHQEKGLTPEAAVCESIGFDVKNFALAYSTAVLVTPERWQDW